MKQFECKWGAGYVDEGKTSTTGASFFSNDNGYEAADLAAINALEVGQTWTAPTNEVHTVTRIA